jgi:hypothetical protein
MGKVPDPPALSQFNFYSQHRGRAPYYVEYKPAADTTPPTVTSRTPSSAATNVLIAKNVVVTFSEPMSSATLSGGSVSYSGPTWSTDKKTATWTHSTSWANGQQITLTLSNWKDTAGNSGTTGSSWIFTTVAAADTTPPTVTTATPTGSSVPITQNVVVTFSEAMGTGTTPTLTQTAGTQPSGGYTFSGWTSGNTVATWTHNNWANSNGITLQLTNYKDVAGNTGSTTSWSFTTVAADELDQQQTQATYNNMLFSKLWGGQSFIPTKPVLTRVEIYIGKAGRPSSPLTLSVRSSINGANLVTVTKPASEISTTSSWVNFDFSDLSVTPGDTYYLVLKTANGNSKNCYYWRYSSNNLYMFGMQWNSIDRGITWTQSTSYDFCFKIYGFS